jgi:hypothetical protein
VTEYLDAGGVVALGALCSDPRSFPEGHPCEALAVRRAGQSIMLPDKDFPLGVGDEVLFCGVHWAEPMLQATLHNPYSLRYVVTGVDEPRGYVFAWLKTGLRRLRSDHKPNGRRPRP